MTLDDILEEIKEAENIIIMAHESPDGDAIGSSLAMCLVLRQMGKNAYYMIGDDEFPMTFDFLPGREYIITESEIKKYDMAICMDCPSINRVTPSVREYFENAKVKITSFKIGTATGVITDTNGFRNTNTTVESLEFAEWAMQNGLNLPRIYRDSMLVMSRTKFEAHKLAMNRMEFFEDGKIAFTYITNADSEALDIKAGEKDGIVEIGKSVRGVEVSIFLYEKEKGYKASLRSNEYVNVAEICSQFGGGGHIKAAGTDLIMTFEEAKKAIISEVAKKL